MQYVYIITSPENEHFNKYKIGETKNGEVKDLLRRYHTALPECKIIEFQAVYDSKKTEKSIHKILDSYRVSGEWFIGDIFLLKHVFLSEVYKNRLEHCEKQTHKSEVLCELYKWFQTFYDPTYETYLVENDEDNMQIMICNATCPISLKKHEDLYHTLSMNMIGDVFLNCQDCNKNIHLGNIGYKSDYFTRTQSVFTPSKEMDILVGKVKVFLDIGENPDVGFSHMRFTSGIVNLDFNGNVFYNSKYLFNKNDNDEEMKIKKKWFYTSKQENLYCLEWNRLEDDTIILTNNLDKCIFSCSKCQEYRYKDGILKCDCTEKIIDGVSLELEMESFFKKYDMTATKRDEKSFLVSLNKKCFIHDEKHSSHSIVRVDDNGNIYMECHTETMNVLTYNKVSSIPLVYEGKWRNLLQEYEKTLIRSSVSNNLNLVYSRFTKWYKQQTRKKIPSQNEFLIFMKNAGIKTKMNEIFVE